jgi:hypothetical protein
VNYGAQLRVEFLIPGAATIASILWLVAEVGGALHAKPLSVAAQLLTQLGSGTGRTILTLLIVIASAYGVGVVTVMGTFVWPAKRLVESARARRMNTLQRLRKAMPDSACALTQHLGDLFASGTDPRAPARPTPRNWWTSDGRWWRQIVSTPRQTSLDLNIAISLARKEMSASAQSEVEYRRSVRQVSLGIAPAVLISTAAAVIGEITGGQSAFMRAGLSLAYLTAGVILVGGLMSSAAYQENVTQALILDIAFIRFWELRREELEKVQLESPEELRGGTKWMKRFSRSKRR